MEVTPRGWRVVAESPVLFTRTPSMRPLPMPVAGGDCAQAAEAHIDFNEQVPHLMEVIARASVSAHRVNGYGHREDEFTITIPRDVVEAVRARLAAELPGYAGEV